jgi:hypothetical protein
LVGEGVAVFVGVADGVKVNVAVGVNVGVAVRVAVAVQVGVFVLEGVNVSLGVEQLAFVKVFDHTEAVFPTFYILKLKEQPFTVTAANPCDASMSIYV